MRREIGGLLIWALFVLAAGNVIWISAVAAESCEEFVTAFRSVPIAPSLLPAIQDFQGPWPEGTYPLETGYGEGCDIGEMARIVAICPNAATYPLIAKAPVIASDPEGFTVVMIGREDHERLKNKDDMLLFYAQCQ